MTEPFAVAVMVRVLPAQACAGVTQLKVATEQVFEPEIPEIESEAATVADKFPPRRGSQRQSPLPVADPVVPAGGLMLAPDGIARILTVSSHEPATGRPDAFEPIPKITTEALAAAPAGRAANRLNKVMDDKMIPALFLMDAPKYDESVLSVQKA